MLATRKGEWKNRWVNRWVNIEHCSLPVSEQEVEGAVNVPASKREVKTVELLLCSICIVW